MWLTSALVELFHEQYLLLLDYAGMVVATALMFQLKATGVLTKHPWFLQQNNFKMWAIFQQSSRFFGCEAPDFI